MAQDDLWREQVLGYTADDNTFAGNLGGDNTMAAPASPDAETQMGPTAWSQNGPDYTLPPIMDYPETGAVTVGGTNKQWSWVIPIVAAVVLVGMVSALGALGMLAWHRGVHGLVSSPPSTVTVTPSRPPMAPQSITPVTPPTTQEATPPTEAPDPARADDTYIAIVESNGLFVYDRAPMIKLGHQQCALLAQGATEADEISALEDQFSDFRANPRGAYGIVIGAITAYCPQFKSGG